LTSTSFNMHALDRLLLERFGSKVGLSLAAELCERPHFSTRMKSLFAPVLTGYTVEDESSTETENYG
jgi:hypothetical protein